MLRNGQPTNGTAMQLQQAPPSVDPTGATAPWRFYWVHVEADSTFARGEKEELVWVMNNGDPEQYKLQKVLCMDLNRKVDGTAFSEVRSLVCGNVKAIPGLQRHTSTQVNLYSWSLPASHSILYLSMSLTGGVAGDDGFTSGKTRDLLVNSGCWMLQGGVSLPRACGEVKGIGTEYYRRLFASVGKVVGSARPDALVLGFSGTHFYPLLKGFVQDSSTELLELTLPDHVKEAHYMQPHFAWLNDKKRLATPMNSSAKPLPRPKLIPKPWDCKSHPTNYTRRCEALNLGAVEAMEQDVKSRSARHVEFALRSARAAFKGPVLWRAPYEPQYDPRRLWGHAETQVTQRFQRAYCEGAAAVLDRFEGVKVLHAERVVAGMANATIDNLHFDGGFQRVWHQEELVQQTVTHDLFRMFLKGLIEVAPASSSSAVEKDKVSILKRMLHRANRLYANWSTALVANASSLPPPRPQPAMAPTPTMTDDS